VYTHWYFSKELWLATCQDISVCLNCLAINVPQTGALLLDGNTLSYFGASIPVNLAAAVIAEVILVGGAEYYRSTNKSPLGSVCHSKPFRVLLAEACSG
jgi:hypothetical protein